MIRATAAPAPRLDGTLARVRHHERPRYGYYTDHVVDAVGTFFLFGGMALLEKRVPAVEPALAKIES